MGFRREMLEDNDAGLNNFEEEFTNVALVSGLRRIVKGGWGGCKVMKDVRRNGKPAVERRDRRCQVSGRPTKGL